MSQRKDPPMPPAFTLEESSDAAVRIMEERRRLLLESKRREIEECTRLFQESLTNDVGDPVPPSTRALLEREYKIRVGDLRAEEVAMAEDDGSEEYTAYMDLLREQFIPLTKTRQVEEEPIPGMLGEMGFTQVRQGPRLGTAFERHEETITAPLRKWMSDYKQSGGKTKIPRRRTARRKPEKKETDPTCPRCATPMLFNRQDGAWACPNDGTVRQDNVDYTVESRPFGDNVDVILENDGKSGGYNRGYHMHEVMQCLQGREGTTPPTTVVDAVLAQRKMRPWIADVDVNEDHIREWLKASDLADWYAHATQLMCIVTGKEPPSLNSAESDHIIKMFTLVEDAYENMPPEIHAEIRNKRTNLLSYKFILFKLCEILGYDHMLRGGSILKSENLLHEHDTIWEYICKRNDWPFYPTLL